MRREPDDRGVSRRLRCSARAPAVGAADERRASRTRVGADDAAAEDKDVPGSALKSLRDRLIQRQQR